MGPDSLRAITIFLRVVERESFSAVAREMRVTQPSISRSIALLETMLGAKLLLRTTRKVTLTEAGRVFYERAKAPARELIELAQEIAGEVGMPKGIVRIAAPGALGRHLLLPILAEVTKALPGISIDLSLSDRRVDLLEENTDIALRVGQPELASLTVRTLGYSPQVIVASPIYLKDKAPVESRDGLAALDWIARKEAGRLLDLGMFPSPMTWRFAADDVETVFAAALRGLGVAILPLWLTRDALEQGLLQRLLSEVHIPGPPVVLCLPSGRQMPARVRAVAEALATQLQPCFSSRSAR